MKLLCITLESNRHIRLRGVFLEYFKQGSNDSKPPPKPLVGKLDCIANEEAIKILRKCQLLFTVLGSVEVNDVKFLYSW